MFNDFDSSGTRVSFEFLGFGDMVAESTINKMKQVIQESAKNLRVIEKAKEIVIGVPQKDQYNEVDTIYNWVRNSTRYVKDPQGTEMIHSPLYMLDQIDNGYIFSGDCDDLTVLVLSLLKAIGYPVALRIAAYRKNGPFQHVYGLVKMYGEWVPVEPIQLDVPVGYEHEGATKTKDYIVQ